MEQAISNDTDVLESVRRVVDEASASRAFGAPVTQDGITVLPAAKVGGGGGGGAARRPVEDGTEAKGSGGGIGLAAKPLGVFVIKQGKVSWRPAIDVNRVILGGQVVAIVALLSVRALVKARQLGAAGDKRRSRRS